MCQQGQTSSIVIGSTVIEQQIHEALMSSAVSSLVSHLSPVSKVPYSLTMPIDWPGSVDQSHVGFDKGTPITAYVVHPSCLDWLQAYLLVREQHQACHYALDQKMWVHTLLIASSLDKEMQKDVTNKFICSELGTTAGAEHGRGSNGWESICVAYSFFSGQGPLSGLFSSLIPDLTFLLVQEISSPKNLAKSSESLQPPLPSLMIMPIFPNIPKSPPTSVVSPEALAK